MTRILLSGIEPKIALELERRLVDQQNDISVAELGQTMEAYEEFHPDIVLLDYNDERASLPHIEKVLEFDHTACIFALVDQTTPHIKDTLYKNGIRVILNKPQLNRLDDFVNGLYNACNDLDHERCIGCWKTNRFDNLTPIA